MSLRIELCPRVRQYRHEQKKRGREIEIIEEHALLHVFTVRDG